VNYVLHDGIISSISPGVFFYYTTVVAPSADFTVNIVQTKSSAAFPYCAVQQDQVALVQLGVQPNRDRAETSSGQASVDVHGAIAGQVFIISVKYSLKALVGTPMTKRASITTSRTEVNGAIVDADPNGLQIGGRAGSGRRGPALGFRRARDSTADAEPVHPRDADGVRGRSTGENVSIRVYDVGGRLVRTLANVVQSPGRHSVAWDGRDEQGTRMPEWPVLHPCPDRQPSTEGTGHLPNLIGNDELFVPGKQHRGFAGRGLEE